MGGLRFVDIQNKALDVLDLTSLTLEEFQILVPLFEKKFQDYMSHRRLDGKKRTARRYTNYANSPLATAEDRLLFILIYVKNNPLQVLHGRLFGIAQCKANQWIHVLLPVLSATLREMGDGPARSISELAARVGISEQEADAVPLFVMMGPNDRLDGQRTRLNKKAVIAARKSAIQ